VRAVVSHDTYAESGKDVLIPKGSRIVGTYNSSILRGQERVFIIWTRVIRPDGVDVAINSPGTDALGRTGIEGDVDNKYFEAFTTAFLSSAMSVGVAAAGEGLFGNQQQTTTSGGSGGGTTTTSSPSTTAMQQAVQNVGAVGQSIVGSTLNIQPIIAIDQGQKINVFVNKDIIFPDNITGKAMFVQ
jgi:type IV secretion system protein VirB10